MCVGNCSRFVIAPFFVLLTVLCSKFVFVLERERVRNIIAFCTVYVQGAWRFQRIVDKHEANICQVNIREDGDNNSRVSVWDDLFWRSRVRILDAGLLCHMVIGKFSCSHWIPGEIFPGYVPRCSLQARCKQTLGKLRNIWTRLKYSNNRRTNRNRNNSTSHLNSFIKRTHTCARSRSSSQHSNTIVDCEHRSNIRE